jgi:hypothetical protein
MLLFATLLPACDQASTGGALDLEALPTLMAEADMRIGSVDDPEAGFSRVAGVDVDGDGQIYVFEAADMQIRVYGPDGRLLRRIGRRGEGPGEFQRVARFGVVAIRSGPSTTRASASRSSTATARFFPRDGRTRAGSRCGIGASVTSCRGR